MSARLHPHAEDRARRYIEERLEMERVPDARARAVLLAELLARPDELVEVGREEVLGTISIVLSIGTSIALTLREALAGCVWREYLRALEHHAGAQRAQAERLRYTSAELGYAREAIELEGWVERLRGLESAA
jgi:hypothetical protein